MLRYVLSALFFVSVAANANCPHATSANDLAAAPYRQIAVDQPGFLNISTLAPISATKLLAGDYADIVLIDLSKRSVVHLAKPANVRMQPSGVYYDVESRTVFSADYLLNKVSVFRLDGDKLNFLFDILGVISPEGVSFDNANNILSVAEFDGHGASAWKVDLQKMTAQKLWRHTVGYAHGVTNLHGKTYVTSLQDRKVHVFDERTGDPIETFGSLGWDAANLQFLWPTSIITDKDGHLVVSDAETGFVSIIDPITKLVTATIGGAGPGRGRFSQPYSVAISGGKMTIISTKDERIVSIDYPSLCVDASYVRNPSDWSYFKSVPPSFHAISGDYLYSSGPRISLFGTEYTIYNSALVNVSKGATVLVGNVTGPGGYAQYKQLQYVRRGNDEYLFSPYSYNGPTVMRRAGNRLYAFNFSSYFGRERRIRDCWNVDGHISCAEKEGYAIDKMSTLMDGFVQAINQGRCASTGFVLASNLLAALRSIMKDADVSDGDLAGVFSSTAGREFWNLYRTTTKCGDVSGSLVRIAQEAMAKPKRASLYELSIMSVVVPK